MNKSIFIIAGALLTTGAYATVINAVNSIDTFINSGNAANKDKANNGDFQVSALGTTNQAWLKFDGAALKSQVAGGTITGIGLTFSVADAVNNSDIVFTFNSNAAWTSPASTLTNQNAATTPYLTWNDSGQAGSTNGRFLGTTSGLGTYSIALRSDVVNTTQTFNFSSITAISDAIAAGTDFTIFLKTGPNTPSGRLTMVTSEGQQPYIDNGFADAVPATLQLQVAAVPEPASMAVLGLGVLGVIRRRKSAK